jgi:hypothetical protein
MTIWVQKFIVRHPGLPVWSGQQVWDYIVSQGRSAIAWIKKRGAVFKAMKVPMKRGGRAPMKVMKIAMRKTAMKPMKKQKITKKEPGSLLSNTPTEKSQSKKTKSGVKRQFPDDSGDESRSGNSSSGDESSSFD